MENKSKNSRKRKGDHSHDPYYSNDDNGSDDTNDSYSFFNLVYDDKTDQEQLHVEDNFDPFECFTANDKRATNNILWRIYEMFIVTMYFRFAVLMNKINPPTFKFVSDPHILEEKDTADLQYEVNEGLCGKISRLLGE